MTDGKIIAFGLLTERDLQALGPSFSRAWPVDQAPSFTQLLEAIDDADRSRQESGTSEQRRNPEGRTPTMLNPIGGGRR